MCAKFGLPCIIYMGAKDMERQALNVFRMRLLGAEVRQPSMPGPHHSILCSFRLMHILPDMTAAATGACLNAGAYFARCWKETSVRPPSNFRLAGLS